MVEQLRDFHRACTIIAIEASRSQPRNELVTELNISANEAILLECLSIKNKEMAMQMLLFITRKITESILKYGLKYPIDSFEELIKTICIFHRSNKEFSTIGKEVSLTMLRLISNICALLEKPHDTPTFNCIFRILGSLISMIVEVNVFRKVLYSLNNIPVAAAIVHVCLEVFQATSRDIWSRLLAARTLRRFILGAKRADYVYQIAFVLPGVLSRVHKVAVSDQNSFILIEALLIVANAVETTMNNRMFDRSQRYKSGGTLTDSIEDQSIKDRADVISVEGSSECSKEAGVSNNHIPQSDIFVDENKNIIVNIVKQMLARLCNNVDFRVRLYVISCLKFLYMRCERVFGKVLERAVEDVGTALLDDTYERIRQKAAALLKLTRNKALKEERLRRKIRELCRSARIQIWRDGDVRVPFQQICGIMRITKLTDLASMFISDGKILEELVDCMVSCAVLNRSSMELVVEVDKECKKFDFCSQLKLRYGIRLTDLRTICVKLAKCDAAESALLYCDNKMWNTNSLEERLAFMIISLLLLRELQTNISRKADEATRNSSIEILCKSFIDRISIGLEDVEVIEKEVINEYDTIVIRHAMDLCVIGAAFRCIDSKAKKCRLLTRCMVHIFEWRASANRLISLAADEAAHDLAEGMHEPSVSLLCLKYANTLLSHICILGDSWQLIRSARLVTALLDLCNEKAFFATACLLNNQMMSVLDRNDTKCTPAVIRAMISFVIDVAEWFPNEKEDDEIYDDEEKSEMNTANRRIPEFVSAIMAILKRTKHLTLSRELRNRLLILKLLKLSLEALANFPNRLCPLVHENWPGVKSNAVGSNFLARKQAFKVIVTMCKTTGSFMYRRFKSEIWPSIEESMMKLLENDGKPGGGNLISETYKYQRSLSVWKSIDPLAEDWESARRMLLMYASSGYVKKDLVTLANDSLQELAQLLK
uniref:TTI1 C-terminal TPR domain-containing protein n=2 Tax=Parascaris univalens TaxID=6257 RepID=A0A915AN70_PARUN